ncbi:histone-lysine N-methyltransferase ASHR1 [Rhizophagus irregularis DAOM 181602=DAOM 197198]|nr:histone-lysine N-methyltransferase ASHR1 [Rhizophagus irregularis DAOM 181602=DAOM 197198]
METFLSQNGLSLVENENKFRSIITNKKIDIGKTIIISHPLISFPILTYNKIRCDQCLKKKENNLQTCSKCQRVYYCDRSCQKSSWISHHKLLCPLYKKSKNNMDEEITEQSINNLKSFEKISNNTYENLNFNKISKDDLINYLCVFYCNNFNLHDNQLFVYGEGTFPIGSLFNHSCRPNAIVMYDALDRVTRKKMLQEKYFFECQCSRCSVQERCSGIFSKIDQLIEEKDQEITKKDFNTSLENWVSSESKLEQNESKFSKVTKYHPMIGLHLFTLGKCYWNDITNGLESVKESINILECAQKVLNITHNEGAENVDIINQ